MNLILQAILLGLVILMAIAINLPQGLLEMMGLDANALKATLLIWIIIGLTVYRGLLIIILTLLLVLGANLPGALAESWGINKDLVIVTLIAFVVVPLGARWFHR